jgi:hypothetical protein
LELFKGPKGEFNKLSKRVSSWESTDREEHVGPRHGQVGPEGWPTDPTLVPTNSKLGGCALKEAAKRNPR